MNKNAVDSFNKFYKTLSETVNSIIATAEEKEGLRDALLVSHILFARAYENNKDFKGIAENYINILKMK